MDLIRLTSTFWVLLIFYSVSFSQIPLNRTEFDPEARGDEGIRVMFYNVENLFDTFDDPTSEDEEFTSNGEKRWNYYRYKEKLNNIAKTIIAVGGCEPPDVVGLCEIENFQVLLDLTSHTPLKNFGYQIVHENSKDARGIDNALLYLPDKIEKIDHSVIEVETDGQFTTRDILKVSFRLQVNDTVHFFVNHWPSRYGGKSFTEQKRIKVAETLKQHLDSVQSVDPEIKIIVMGDFKYEPNDKSILNALQALPPEQAIIKKNLYNLSYEDFRNGKGTITYKEIDYTWFLFDQFIVSGSLIDSFGLKIKGMKSQIFQADWLIEDGRPFRSFQGPIYRAGFSDHLPIFLDLYNSE